MGRSVCLVKVFVCLALTWPFCVGAFAQGDAPFGDGAYIPPSPAKSASPLPSNDLESCLAARRTFHIFQDFEGATKALEAEAPKSKGTPLKGGEVVETDLAGSDLLGVAVSESGGVTVYVASIVSVDAEGVKLRLDVTGLRPGEEAWVVDPVNLASFGPYTATTGNETEVWAAMVVGDEAVLLVKSPYEDTPGLALTAYSHIFLSLQDVAKELRCNVDIACETDPATLEASSGVAIILVQAEWFCSGTLINNSQTPEFEPYFITANHCICSQDQSGNTEAIWDYRTAECGGTPPVRDSLPLRSYGQQLLATNAPLDATLIRLGEVPVGSYGRSYLGWDARLLNPGEPIKCIHHPDATNMRITRGAVVAINEKKNGRENQTRVHWDVGVTEAGSSGSCLLLDNPAENNRIVGTLSQGPNHSCVSNEDNIDWFASFHDFYPAIQPYIGSATPSTAQGADDCRTFKDNGCPLSQAYSGAPAALQGLRAFRDHVLMAAPGGPGVVAGYYKAAPALAPLVARSTAARGAVIAASSPFVRLGAMIKLFSD
ncbi:MAG: hypothetical protein NTZ09_00595 [Candidatus Hydrogenedentes bacterium]|nr:hypothetical protein [Candidatus Hydrogenedentota bacterium]